jgi:hypothetical protein
MNATEHRIVAFVDILGFKTLLQAWASDSHLPMTVESALRDATEYVGGKYGLRSRSPEDWRVRMFSDCACISQPATPLGLMRSLEGVALFQRTMITNGLLVRGGVALGRHYESTLTLMSNALLDAYELEQHHSGLPRILLSRKLLEFVEGIEEADIRTDMKELITFEGHDVAFVCYVIFEEEDNWLGGEPFYRAQHDLISKTLANPELNITVRQKYVWLAEYHNWCLFQTARLLKQSGRLAEDEVWHLNLHWVREIPLSRRFACAAWTDRSLKKAYDGNQQNGVDWIREWPGASSDDDEPEDYV